MDIREYFKKEQRGFYKIISVSLTRERGKQLYDAINEWHESELKLLGITDDVGQGEQLFCDCQGCGENKKVEYCEKCYAENLPDIAKRFG